jgi:hypothetical protein
MLEPLVREIEVACDQEMAFDVFMEMGTWWPTERFATSIMRGDSVRELRVEAVEGGRITEMASDGQQHVWGVIRVFDPHDYLKLDFHVPHPSESAPGFSTVEVRFDSLGPKRTRVQLTQSNWEGLGDVAEMVQRGYGQAWGMIFEVAYKEACEDRAKAQAT